MSTSILALNAGSTSLKFGLFAGGGEELCSGDIDWAAGDRTSARLRLKTAGGPPECSTVGASSDTAAAGAAIRTVLDWIARRSERGWSIIAVGHRVVHGGSEFRESRRIDARVKGAIDRLGRLAPLHNPPALRAIEAAELALPGIPQVAVFDSSFFAALPPRACVYPLPYAWYETWGIRRFGFHGLSHAYCATRTSEMLGRAAGNLRLVTCHLGGGCSAAAIQGGRPVASTMGFSPLEGLMMGTRSGSIDPGILLYLQQEQGLSASDVDHALNHESGLLGVSGVSAELAKIEAAAAAGNSRAQLAADLFADRVRAAIGALATSLGGLDAVVFTDRIGEQSSRLRAAACEHMEFLGIHLDKQRNLTAVADTDVATPSSPARILVIHTREEWMVAREAQRLAG